MTGLRRAVAALVVAGVVAGSAGCGVPGSSAPIDRGPAPAAGVQQPQPVPPEPLGPDTAVSAQDLVQRYLQAAAWGNSKSADRPTAVDDAEQRVRKFLTPNAEQRWTPGNRDLTLVRVSLAAPVSAGDGASVLDAVLEPVGILDDLGSVDPPASAEPIHTAFRVVPVGGGQRRLDAAPSGLFLNVDELDTWYDQRTIYFWSDSDKDAVLVPDLRYMPRAVSADKQPNEIWRWLSKGPSSLLANAVAPWPDNVKKKDNLVTEQQHGERVLVVNLTSEAAQESPQLQDLVTQIRWSLRQINPYPIELRIEGTKKDLDGSSSQYLRRNPAVWPVEQNEPEKLVVYEGRARTTENLGDGGPTVLDADQNHDVVTAAYTRIDGEQRAALVRADPSGLQRLWLGRLVVHGDSPTPEYVDTGVVGTALSRPVWLARPAPQVLLSVDGQLKVVTTGRQRDVAVPFGMPGAVTAVAAAPDGRRLALIAGGVAGIAPLRVEGDTLSLGAFRPLSTGLGEPRGISWSSEDRVLVGGAAAGGSPLVELSIDGATRSPIERTNLAGLVISRLVAYPDDPIAPSSRTLALFEANGQAYNLYGQQVETLLVDDEQASPSAGTAERPSAPVPTAPFFYEVFS